MAAQRKMSQITYVRTCPRFALLGDHIFILRICPCNALTLQISSFPSFKKIY